MVASIGFSWRETEREREREREIEFVGLKNLLWASVEEFVSELQFAFVIGLQPNSDVKYIFLSLYLTFNSMYNPKILLLVINP